jgi:hypothetical protein
MAADDLEHDKKLFLPGKALIDPGNAPLIGACHVCVAVVLYGKKFWIMLRKIPSSSMRKS